MRRIAFACVLCALTISAAAHEPNTLQTQPPALAEPESDAGRDKPATQPQSAAPATIIVNVQPPPKTEAEAQKEESERQEKTHLERRLVELTGDLADYTRWLAYATAALFAVTAGLFAFAVRQARDAKEAGRSAGLSAEAAKLSAEAAVKAERAIVIATGYKIGVPPGVPLPPNNITPPSVLNLQYRFVNLGRTPAEVKDYSLEIFEGSAIPETPTYERIYPMVPGTFIMPGDSIDMKEIFQYNDARRHRVEQESNRLVFYGFVKWVDYLGDSHESRFCTRVLAHHQGPGKWFVFVLDGDTPEAYTRRT